MFYRDSIEADTHSGAAFNGTFGGGRGADQGRGDVKRQRYVLCLIVCQVKRSIE